MRRNIYAVFPEVGQARSALGALLDHGARPEDISLIVRETHIDDFQKEEITAGDVKHSVETGISTTTGADAASGAAQGAGIGLGLGAFAALVALFVPGIGLVIGGGALASAIAGTAGATAAGAVAGGITGYLKDQGFSEGQSLTYVDSFQEGAAILGVSVPSGPIDEPTVHAIFGKYQDVSALTVEGTAAPVSHAY